MVFERTSLPAGRSLPPTAGRVSPGISSYFSESVRKPREGTEVKVAVVEKDPDRISSRGSSIDMRDFSELTQDLESVMRRGSFDRLNGKHIGGGGGGGGAIGGGGGL